MTNSKVFFKQVVEQLQAIEPDEAEAIAALMIEKKYGLTRGQAMQGREVDAHIEDLRDWITRVNAHEPVHYVLGEQFFLGRPYTVTPAVLIPRPETEELVEHLIRHFAGQAPKVLDVGTGSGCIAISLALALPRATVHATDVSEQALAVASENAHALQAKVQFHSHDILQQEPPINNLDLLVSNPPYIGQQEAHTLHKNVLEYEPHTALFAPGNDPLVFYKSLAKAGVRNLKRGGMLAVEINERYGAEVKTIFETHSLQAVEVVKDITGKDRFVYGSK